MTPATCQAKMTFETISLDRIKVFPRPHGPSFEDVDEEGLAASIAAHGIQQPLLVCPIEGEPSQFALVCGQRRLKAAMACEMTEAPALIQTNLAHGRSECREAIQRIQLEENLHHRSLTAVDQARLISGYQQDHGLSVSQTARNLGLSRRVVTEYLRIGELLDTLAVRRRTGDENGGDVYDQLKDLSKASLLVLAEHKDEQVFSDLLARLTRGESARSVARVAARKTGIDKSRPGFAFCHKYSGELFSGQVKVTVKVDVVKGLKERPRNLDPEIREQGLHALPDVLQSIESAILAVVPVPPSPTETDAQKTQSHRKEKPLANNPEPSAPHPSKDPASGLSPESAADSKAEAKDEPLPSGAMPARRAIEADRQREERARRALAELKAATRPPSEATKRVWQSVLAALLPQGDRPGQRTWLGDGQLFGEAGDRIVIGLADDHACYYVKTHYADKLAAMAECGPELVFVSRMAWNDQ